MDFIDQLKQFSKRVESLKDSVLTEEATKTSIIMPFFSMLGYDVFNPQEFMPEYIADVGIKKGEKVDYAILQNGVPVILIEAKSINQFLENHDSQLFRYFGTSKAKFAILTNGIIYRFFTDLEETNKMDQKPFLEVNILDIRENQVPELKKFQKGSFDIEMIFDTASQLKYANEFKQIINEQLQNPTDEFVKLFLSASYSGRHTQAVIERFRPILKKSLNDYINETMNQKIKSALDQADKTEEISEDSKTESDKLEEEQSKTSRRIVTTEEELEGYFIVKNLLKDLVEIKDITYKDTESYINILYKGSVRKWICRLYFSDKQKYMTIPGDNKKESRLSLESAYDIEKYRTQLEDTLKRCL
jgi:hypothetical protein